MHRIWPSCFPRRVDITPIAEAGFRALLALGVFSFWTPTPAAPPHPRCLISHLQGQGGFLSSFLPWPWTPGLWAPFWPVQNMKKRPLSHVVRTFHSGPPSFPSHRGSFWLSPELDTRDGKRQLWGSFVPSAGKETQSGHKRPGGRFPHSLAKSCEG